MPDADDTEPVSIEARLAANVRGERASRRWRQSDLAEHLGMTQRAISEIESGRRQVSLAEIVSLCRTFGIPLSELLRGADSSDIAVLGLQ
jgi:transcriptional regulator with XRE-family HTH domain